MRDKVWTKSTRVLAVWLVCVVAFALFNAAYWPIHAWQQWNAEPNYLARAEAALLEGQQDEAKRILQHGIEQFHPLSATAWQLHAELLDDAGVAATSRWYAVLGESEFSGAEALYPDGLPPAITALDLSPLSEPLAILHGALLEASFESSASTWSPHEQLAHLQTAQGRLVTDGAIGRTGVEAPVHLLVQSGGGVGARRVAHIFVDGIDYASQRRGLHAAIVDPENGAVLQSGRFDLWEHTQEAHRMLRFLEDAPEGSIGLFAVFDDASVNLDRSLEEALLNFGLHRKAWIEGRLRLFGIRYSFAAIGVKGSAMGTALQAWTPESYGGMEGHPVAVMVLTGEGAPT